MRCCETASPAKGNSCHEGWHTGASQVRSAGYRGSVRGRRGEARTVCAGRQCIAGANYLMQALASEGRLCVDLAVSFNLEGVVGSCRVLGV